MAACHTTAGLTGSKGTGRNDVHTGFRRVRHKYRVGLLAHWNMDKLGHEYSFKCIFFNETDVLITHWLRSIFTSPLDNTCQSAFVQATAVQRTDNCPFSEPMIKHFTGAYICKMYNWEIKWKMSCYNCVRVPRLLTAFRKRTNHSSITLSICGYFV